MSIPISKEKDLEDVYIKFHEKCSGVKQDYYGLIYLSKKFKRPMEELLDNVAFGGHDYGIDGYYFDRETKNFYIYQFKWSENHNLFKDSLDRLIESGISILFNGTSQENNKNDIILKAKSELNEYREIIKKVYIDFVFKGNTEKAEESIGLNHRREDLENKKYILDQYFENSNVQLAVQFIGDTTVTGLPPETEKYNIHCSDCISTEDPKNNGKLLCCFISINELHDIYKNLGQKFLSRNIRAGLNPNNPPNRKLRNAFREIIIEKNINPDIFCFNHNGITLAVQSFNKNCSSLELIGPRLLNGAQTLTSFQKFLEANEGNKKLKENKEIIPNIKIFAKIIKYDGKDDSYITNITIANNQQNPVEPWNLRANDKIQYDLQDKFAEEIGIYYSRQENAFENFSDKQLENIGIIHYKDIKIKQLTQVFLGVHGDILYISRLRDVFESDSRYKNTFPDECLKYNSKSIVLGVKALMLLNPVIKEMEKKIALNLVPALKASRNLTYSLLLQGILNDKNFDDLIDLYGNSLIKEFGYKEYLKKLGRTKVLKILRSIYHDKESSKKIEKQKYGFLRSKEVYNKAVNKAKHYFGWNKINRF